MGLAERFKYKLEQKDIFKKNKYTSEVTENVESAVETFAPQKESIKNILAEETDAEPVQIYPHAKFEELETEIIGKIRKTPCWADYSTTKQENMISKYFDNKVQKLKYSKIEYSATDKLNFIQDILALANYK